MKRLGIVARDEFVAAVEAAVALSGSEGAMAIACTDLDRFGELNDELGSAAGDAALKSWERVLTGSVPKSAIIRRLGGDEYAVGLANTTAENALILLKEIRAHCAEHPVEGVGRPVTAVFGVAARPPHADSVHDLLRCADAALMRGKRDGGNRVAIYIEEKMVLKSNYYPRADLDRLARVAASTERTEASLLREALADVFAKYRDL